MALPIHRMPDELFGLIFDFLSTTVPTTTSGGETTWPPGEITTCELSPQVTVSHVCRHWRLLCLSTTHCWADISLNLNMRDPSILDVLVSRAGDLFVRLSLYHHGNIPSNNASQIAMLRTTASLLNRFSILSISFLPSCDTAIKACLRAPAPQLESLTLHRSRYRAVERDYTLRMPSDTLTSCQSLQRLDVAGVLPSLWNFSALRTLTISNVELTLDDLSGMLAGCPALSKLSLVRVREKIGQNEPFPPHPNLVHVSIESCPDDLPYRLLCRLRTKDIQSIEITDTAVSHELVAALCHREMAIESLRIRSMRRETCVAWSGSHMRYIQSYDGIANTPVLDYLRDTHIQISLVTSLSWAFGHWRALLAHCAVLPHLETLVLVFVEEDVNACIADPDVTGMSTLHCVTLRCVEFRYTDWNPPAHSPAEFYVNFVRECLNYDGVLSELRIHGMKMLDGPAIAALQEAATVVAGTVRRAKKFASEQTCIALPYTSQR